MDIQPAPAWIKTNRLNLRTRNFKYVFNYLSKHPCVDCGEADPEVLEFDHVKGKKKQCVSHLWRMSHSIDTIQKEIDKCEIRCANCHKRRHHKIRNGKDRGVTPQQLGGKARGWQERKEALSRYHTKPHFCWHCHRMLEVAHRRVADVIKKKFCNSSCAAIYNNLQRST